jgi:putative membrane protein
MTLRVLLAVLHLIALGIGLGAVWARARSLEVRPLDITAVRRAFAADTWWGVAAGLWLTTGLWRLLASVEKPTSYYMQNHVFYTKMGFFVLILILEISPMIALIRWRRDAGRNRESWTPDESVAARISTISYIEAALVLAMVLAATAMARGVGA